MRIPLDRQSAVPLYQQIKTYLRQGILSGSLAADTRLPASRQLAQDLGVNRITVENAYAELEAEGLIFSKLGSGTYVLSPDPLLPLPKNNSGTPWPLWQQNIEDKTLRSKLLEKKRKAARHPHQISFATGISDANLFPAEDFRKVLQTVMRRDGITALDYGERSGYAPLRESITHILASQGLQTRPENILITSGSQQALSLVAQSLLKPGDIILVESPTHAGALDLFHTLDFKVVGIPVDAHDFNNILTALMGYASLLQTKMEESDPKRTYVKQILTLSERAAEVTKSLLTFGRKQRISCKPFKINDTIRETVNLLTRLLNEDIIVKVALSTKNPTIMADRTQIHQVLINLATNARDAMPEGGTFSIRTQVVSLSDKFRKTHGYGGSGTYVLITAADTGIGMDEATKARIFEPFFTTKEVGKGTGLGLASVYGIVMEQKGHIAVDSEPGHGTTFRIHFPVVQDTQDGMSLQNGEIRGGNDTILIVEDNPDVRGLVTEVLQERGYTTLEAADGEGAVRVFMENNDKIDLVIIDVVLPKKNGREVYEEIIKTNPNIKTLFTSGHTDDIILEKGIEDGSFEFIAKPLLPDDLLFKVRQVLDK